MDIRKKKNRVRMLSLLLMLCMMVGLFPATTAVAGPYRQGYWGNTVFNKHVGGKENITIAEVNADGDIVWENVAYCYNMERGYPVGKYDGTTYSNEYGDLESQDGDSWKRLSENPNPNYTENMKDILTKIVFIGYPYDSNDGNNAIQTILRDKCKVNDEYIEDAFRTSTQKAVWHITDNRPFIVPSNGAVPTGNTSAQVSDYVGKIIFERALDFNGDPELATKLWKWVGPNQRNQHLLDTGYNLLNPVVSNGVKVQILATKQIDGGRIPIGDNKFQFKLTGNNQEWTVENDGNGNILFPMTFTQPGTYTYEINEVTDERDGVTFDFDQNEKTVTVTITSQDLQTFDPNKTYYAFEENDYDNYYYVDTNPGEKGIVMYCTNAEKTGPQYADRISPRNQTYRAIINPTVDEIEAQQLVHTNLYGKELNNNLKKLFYYFGTIEGGRNC